MNILVTGGAGYIGSHTCVELLNAGHRVVVIDNFSNSDESVIENIERITGQHVTCYADDVRNRHVLYRIFSKEDIDVVIHFAGLKAVGESVKQPSFYYQHNLDCTLSLIREMHARGVKKLIFSSSACVYSEEGDPKKTEQHALAATNPYGMTKLIQERILEDAIKAGELDSVVILRYFNPIGAHESGLIGEDPKEAMNLAPVIAQYAAGMRKELCVFGDDYNSGDGTCIRDYIHVTDLAKGHLAAMEALKKHGISIYNLGTGRGHSVFEVIESFEKAIEHRLSYKVVDRRPGDVEAVWADNSKAVKELGWKPEFELDDMTKSLWNYFKTKYVV